mmetsp:Transcript_37376/g.48355  ORF Transcript_37376/g.48355 Transcript_37376/m.48355 type:complete len:192 (-) Transcript_37376:137-712(-)
MKSNSGDVEDDVSWMNTCHSPLSEERMTNLPSPPSLTTTSHHHYNKTDKKSCHQVIDNSIQSPCHRIRLHSSISNNETRQICLLCLESPCHFHMYLNWTSDNDNDDGTKSAPKIIKQSHQTTLLKRLQNIIFPSPPPTKYTWFDKLIEHVYVIHYTGRPSRKVFMNKRLKKLGIKKNQISFVDNFDNHIYQ